MKLLDYDWGIDRLHIKPLVDHRAPYMDEDFHSVWIQFLGLWLYLAWE